MTEREYIPIAARTPIVLDPKGRQAPTRQFRKEDISKALRMGWIVPFQDIPYLYVSTVGSVGVLRLKLGIGHKECSLCRKLKRLSKFPPSAKSKDYHFFVCFECENQRKIRIALIGSNLRRVRELKAGGSHTESEWQRLVADCGSRCLSCGRSDVFLTRDHIIPVSLGGSSNISNIQPLCRSCNSKKGNRTINFGNANTTQPDSRVLAGKQPQY